MHQIPILSTIGKTGMREIYSQATFKIFQMLLPSSNLPGKRNTAKNSLATRFSNFQKWIRKARDY